MTETTDLSSLGAPGEALAKIPVRRVDEAPAGLAVRREGDGGPLLTPVRRISGEEAKLAVSRRTFPRGIRVQAIIDTEGRVRQGTPRGPVLLKPGPTTGFDASALDALCDWRFQPPSLRAPRPGRAGQAPGIAGTSRGSAPFQKERALFKKSPPFLNGGSPFQVQALLLKRRLSF